MARSQARSASVTGLPSSLAWTLKSAASARGMRISRATSPSRMAMSKSVRLAVIDAGQAACAGGAEHGGTRLRSALDAVRPPLGCRNFNTKPAVPGRIIPCQRDVGASQHGDRGRRPRRAARRDRRRPRRGRRRRIRPPPLELAAGRRPGPAARGRRGARARRRQHVRGRRRQPAAGRDRGPAGAGRPALPRRRRFGGRASAQSLRADRPSQPAVLHDGRRRAGLVVRRRHGPHAALRLRRGLPAFPPGLQGRARAARRPAASAL